MSENGPYNQPPQNPYGGGDGTGGQPPYGQPQGGPYGDPGTGGQPGYGQAPYPGHPGPGVPGQDQGMYAGGQPPYGPGPGGYPPPQPPQGGGSKAGLWVVIGGGVVIVVLVIAVVVMLVTNGNRGEEVATGPDETSEVTEEEPQEEVVEEDAPDGGGGTLGEPPHALPTEPCEAFTEQVQADFLLRDTGNKYVSDSSASCSNTADAPGSDDDSAFGSLDMTFKIPYGASDSPEAAADTLEQTLERLLGGGGSERYDADDIEENKEIADLGDEAHFVLTKAEMLDEKLPEAKLLIRQDNLVIELTYYVDTLRGEAEDLDLPDNTEEIMVNAANEAIGVIGN
jgi:hypothetical protein